MLVTGSGGYCEVNKNNINDNGENSKINNTIHNNNNNNNNNSDKRIHEPTTKFAKRGKQKARQKPESC